MDYTVLLFVLPAALLSMYAQFLVKNRFSTYDKVKSKRGITGAQAAKYLLQKNGITDVKIAHISGSLSDNYNPTNKVLSLSDSNFNSTSIAAIGVAAHEVGHVFQHKQKYAPVKIRTALVPVLNYSSFLMWPLIILGLIFEIAFYSTWATALISFADCKISDIVEIE